MLRSSVCATGGVSVRIYKQGSSNAKCATVVASQSRALELVKFYILCVEEVDEVNSGFQLSCLGALPR